MAASCLALLLLGTLPRNDSSFHNISSILAWSFQFYPLYYVSYITLISLLKLQLCSYFEIYTMANTTLWVSPPSFFRYVWSGLLVLLGIFLNVYSKNMDKISLSSVRRFWSKSVEERKTRTLSQTV